MLMLNINVIFLLVISKFENCKICYIWFKLVMLLLLLMIYLNKYKKSKNLKFYN